MSSRRALATRIAVLAADGFEKVELTVPVKALRAAGADVDVVSLRRGRIRGLNLNLPATRVNVDLTTVVAGRCRRLRRAPGTRAASSTPTCCASLEPARELVRDFVEKRQAGRHRCATGRGCSRRPGSSRGAR